MEIIDILRGLIGEANVLTGPEIGGFSRDWSGSLKWQPLCVVRPGSTAEVSEVLQATWEAGVPVVPVSGNTGVSGGTTAEGAVMLSLARMNRIRAINEGARTATVEAGVVVETLHRALAERDLVFPLLFGAQGTAMVGGALSTNAGGSNVLRYGNARALCLGLEAVLPDGRVLDLMSALHKDNSGYDLRDLMIGAEGTLGVITGAVLRLFPMPRAHVTAMLACRTLAEARIALEAVQEATGGGVEAFEYMPDIYIARHIARIPGAREPFAERWPVNILLQVAATAIRDAVPGPDGVLPLQAHLETALAGLFEEGAIGDAVIARSGAEVSEMWARRDAAAELSLSDPPFVASDAAVPTDRIEDFLEEAGAAAAAVDPGCEPFWVAHLGDGNVHYTLRLSRDDPALKEAVMEAVEAVVAGMGGSFSAEHGVGVSKLGAMARRKDPVAVAVMRAIKAALDPKGLMNPGKVLPET